MKKIIHIIIVILFFTSLASAQNQDIGLNYSLGFNQANYKFNYNDKVVGDYSLGWYATATSAEALLSGYGGITLFTNKTHRFHITKNGNVGIGIQNPRALLDVGKYIPDGTLGIVLGRLQEGDGTLDGTYLGVKGHATQGGTTPSVKSFSLVHNFYGRTNSSINFFRGGAMTGGFIAFNTDEDTEKMRITKNGNVGIGTTDPKNKLSVNGTIWAKEVKVALNDAADWVFEPDYQLKSLEEVEAFINEQKHLPDMPSADEFRENDLNVAQMDNLLLQKIEELTLYMIAINNEVKELKAENERLKEKLDGGE